MIRALVTGLALVCMASVSASARCVDDSRPATIGNSGVNVRAYICRDGDVHFRTEFHRLSSGAMSYLLSGNRSAALEAMIGRPRLQTNAVSSTFGDILKRFASKWEVSEWTNSSVLAAAPGGGVADVGEGAPKQPVTVLPTDWGNTDGYYYPAINEIRSLLKGRVPSGMRRKGDYLWRFMSARDVDGYGENLRAYNAMFPDNSGGFYSPAGDDPTISLMSHLGRRGFPNDFTVLVGWYSEGGCATGQGWIFEYFPRIAIIDSVVIENLSSGPLNVSALLGAQTDGGLRKYARARGTQKMPGLTGPIGRGERVLVPTGLVFAPDDELRPYTNTAYSFGPFMSVSGLVANGKSIDFENRSANFLKLSLLPESGSCPFLMSWHEGEAEWRDNGKILHRANAAEKEYEEVRTFEGFRGRFRLEEREPEIAYIDRAVLAVELEDGGTIEIAPDRDDLKSVDEKRAVFRWGEAIDFAFALPEDVAAAEVRTSTLRVTGHYVQYLSLAAASMPGPLLPHTARMPGERMPQARKVCLPDAEVSRVQ